MIENKVLIIDTTLRDGEQTPGLVFKISEKIEIVDYLCKCNIQEIEAGIPAIGINEINDIKTLINLNFPINMIGWCRAKINDIDTAFKSGLKRIHISFPVSNVLMEVFNFNEKTILNNLNILIKYAKKYCDFVSVGAQDAGRANFDFLKTFTSLAYENKADRIRVADTVGIMNPINVFSMIKELKDFVPINIEFHAHNDLGMATANSCIAVIAGANAVSVTVNGIGERAGNAALEETVMALETSFNVNTGINTKLLYSLSKLVSKYSYKVGFNKPITGKNIFTHESGIHTHALNIKKESYIPYQPQVIGRKKNTIVFGKHSGKKALNILLTKNNIILNDIDLLKVLDEIKKISASECRSVKKSEIISICNKLLNTYYKESKAC